MNKKYIGKEGWQGDLTISKTREESFVNVEASQSYAVRCFNNNGNNQFAYRPRIGSRPTHNGLLNGLILRSWDVTSDGNYYLTKCNWGTKEETRNDAGEDDGGGDTSSDEAKEREGMTISKDTNVVEYSIINHPKYATTPWGAKDILILSLWLSGNISINDLSQSGSPLDCEKFATPDNPQAVMEIMKAGKKTFKCNIATYTIKYTVKRLPKNPFKSMAKIAKCRGIKFDEKITIDGVQYPVNYLKSSVSVTKMSRYKYSISESYRQSPAGGWDKSLYGK